jgi:azurin
MKNILIICLILFVWVAPKLGAQSTSPEEVYYQIKKIPIPQGEVLEVGGMAFDDQGRLAVCTRRGEVWLIKNPQSPQPTFKRFAAGLHEPLGLAFRKGSFYLAQRGELTKLTDTNNDDKADLYENIYTWDLVGNYHEYSYGPVFLPDGDMLVTLNLGWVGRGASLSKWHGWMLRITQEGEMTPIATGMRSPAGFGLNEKNDVFYAENQGDWVGSGRISHISEGDFVGHPEGLKWSGEPKSPVKLKMTDIEDKQGLTLYEYAQKKKGIKPPSVWFPHGLMGISTSDIKLIPQGFGPFTGQLLVGDQGQSKIMRVYHEKVNGVYQGVCFPFREGFSSGLLRFVWGQGDDKGLYAGMTNRGWSSTGREPFGIERLEWTGKTPFEMKEIHSKPDGFEIIFTQAIDKKIAENLDLYQITDFTYQYHHLYGSPPIKQEKRMVHQVEISEDGLSVRIYLDKLREGFVYEIKTEGIKNKTGENLLHNFAYYTLNQIPEGAKKNHSHHSDNQGKSVKTVQSKKRITQIPQDWTKGAEQTIILKTLPGLKFDKTEITIKAGAKVKLTFNNPDDMLHNLLIVKGGSIDQVAKAAQGLGLSGYEKAYVPDLEVVIYHTTLLQPNSADVIYFIAPPAGQYEFVCTVPGHSASMRGILKVVN